MMWHWANSTFFSQRHILVKGCGKGNPADGGDTNASSSSVSSGVKPAYENENPAVKDKDSSDSGSPAVTDGN